MAKLEGLRIRNFRSLRDVTLGKLWNTQNVAALTPLTVVIGKNGVGKSALLDAFGFLGDCLRHGVEEACYLRERGGFVRIRSQGVTGPIEFELYYKEHGNARPITYELAIALDKTGRPYVQRERLRQRRQGQSYGQPYSFLNLFEGKGWVWRGETSYANDQNENISAEIQGEDSRPVQEDPDKTPISLIDQRKLGIATLGSLQEHPRITRFREFLDRWYLSYFSPKAAREISKVGPQKHLNVDGSNLGNVVQFLEKQHKARFAKILGGISGKIPGILDIKTHKDDISENLYLLFYGEGFDKPFTHYQMSDGTLKLFSYLLLLEDPDPPPFICIEEPENGLYHKLLETLAIEFRAYADEKRSQIFMTTHQPYLLDALDAHEVWVIEKGQDGFSKITRASEIRFVSGMVEEGQPLGALWYSDYLDAR